MESGKAKYIFPELFLVMILMVVYMAISSVCVLMQQM
jgi:hypothetical protein